MLLGGDVGHLRLDWMWLKYHTSHPCGYTGDWGYVWMGVR